MRAPQSFWVLCSFWLVASPSSIDPVTEQVTEDCGGDAQELVWVVALPSAPAIAQMGPPLSAGSHVQGTWRARRKGRA